MTINTANARVQQNGDGLSTTFPVPFYFLEADDLLVYLGGLPQTLTTDYSVAGAGNPAGGSVTFSIAPPAGTGNVVIIRDPDLLQSTRYPANDPFPAKTHETALDKLTMLVQRARDLIGRAFTLPDGDASGASLTVPAPQAGYLIGWNVAGNGLANFANTGGGSTLPLPVSVANGGTGAGNAAAARTNLGLTLGTAATNVPQLDGGAKLPNSTLKHPTAARSSNTILAAADNNTSIKATTTFTQTFTAAATLGDGWHVFYRNDGTGIVTLDPNGTDQIDGAATLNLYPGEGCMIVCDGAGFRTYGRSTGMVLIQRQVIGSAVATVDFTIGLNSDFDYWRLCFANVVPVTDDTSLGLRFSEDNGATFKSGATDYGNNFHLIQNGTSNPNVISSDRLQLSTAISNTATSGGVNGSCELFNLTGTTGHKWGTVFSAHARTGSGMEFWSNGGRYNQSSNPINAMRLLLNSGNIASGSIALYGVRKS